MRDIDKELYVDCMTLFNKWTTRLSDLETENVEDALDTGYAILNEIRKSLEKFSSKIQAMLCLILLQKGVKSWKTEHTTGTVNIRMSATPPKLVSNPEKYRAMMKALKIPEDVYEKELVRVHYPAYESYCTEIMARGEPAPAGIEPSSMRGLPKITFRKKKGITE